MTALPESDAPQGGDFDLLLRAAVDCALASDDFAAALARFRAAIPDAAPQSLAAMPSDDYAHRALAFGLLREVWRVLPRPERNWRPLPLPKPDRNAPCPCGSGRKFKQCCGGTSAFPDFGKELSVLGLVLERMPAQDYAALPFKQLDPEEVAHAADQWMAAERHGLAIALLEAQLADRSKLDERHEWAFDLLGNAYMDIGCPDRRAALVDAMMQAPNLDLRVAAMHRRCTMHADAGEYESAWSLFREAQRADPDSPALAHLELVMLASQNDVERLASRSRFWAARLRKLGYEGERILELIDDIAASPEDFVAALEAQEQPSSGALLALLALCDKLPPPQSHYRLQATDGDAGPLEPDAALAKLEREWRVVTGDDDWDAWQGAGWIAWLAERPLAWQSFAVLDDLTLAIDTCEFDAEATGELLDDIEDALLAHAVALLRCVIAANRAERLTLEWGWLENRPALRLLAQKIDIEAGTEDELPLLEWLLALSPNDNLGFRERLIHAYCTAGRPGDALAACDHYPGDILPGVCYGRVLALVLLDRRAEATVALAAAQKALPKVLKTLAAARPKRPASAHPGYITHGGDDQAWEYRQQYRAAWEATGALDWLRRAAGNKG